MSPASRPVRRVALTGGIGTGKSYVRHRLEQLGVPVIDADILARAAVAPGTPGLAAVVERFGTGVLDADGGLDRQALAGRAFGDAEARRDLEAIIHPVVRQRIDEWFVGLAPSVSAFAVAEIPLLYETGRDRDFEAVIVVACSPATQFHRVLARPGMSEADAHRRLAAQLPIDWKVARANHVITTDGTFDETDTQVARVHAALQQRFTPNGSSPGQF
jgi:dephospho-CoA kinase